MKNTYKRTFKEICLTTLSPDTGYGDVDMGSVAQCFYRDFFRPVVNYERGETWITPIGLLENLIVPNSKLKPYKQLEKLCSEYSYEKNGKVETPKEFKKRLISRVSQLVNNDQASQIGHQYHCLANFGCLPFALNIWRGGRDFEKVKNNEPEALENLNRKRLGDFPDLFFESVRCYLQNVEPVAADAYGKQIGYSSIERDKLSNFDWWFEIIGCKKTNDGVWDEAAWINFVFQNQLMNGFVAGDELEEVVKLFDHKIGDPFPRLDTITDNIPDGGYGFEELALKLADIPDIQAAVRNTYAIWDERAQMFHERYVNYAVEVSL